MSSISNQLPSKWRLIAVIAVVIVAAIWISKLGSHEPKAAAIPEVLVTPATERDVPIITEWIGTTDGYVNAIIRAQVTGYLQKQNYIEGALVKKDDVLFSIDERPFQAALEQARGQLGQAQARLGKADLDVTRYTPLAAQNAISQQELDDAIQAKKAAEAAVISAQAQIDAAQLNLDFTKVRSLIDGIAGIANAQVGDLIGPSTTTPLTTVSTVDPIKVYFSVSEQDYMKAAAKVAKLIKANSSNTSTPDLEADPAAETGTQFPLTLVLADGTLYPHIGKFLLADRQVDTRTGAIRMAASFPNPEKILRPGQYGKVRGTTRIEKNAVLVPQRAVVDLQGSFLVMVVGEDGTISVRSVKVAERIGSDWIISQGVEAGESVVVEGQQRCKAGEKVIAKPWVVKVDKKAKNKNPASSSASSESSAASEE